MKYLFSLNEKQEKEFEEWEQKIKEIHGSYGSNKFIFSPTSIGVAIHIKNSFVKKPLDLSHVEDW